MRARGLTTAEHRLACLHPMSRAKLDPARKFLLANFVDSYVQLDESEREEYEALLSDERNREVAAMELTLTTNADRLVKKGYVEGLEEGKREGRARGARGAAARPARRPGTRPTRAPPPPARPPLRSASRRHPAAHPGPHVLRGASPASRNASSTPPASTTSASDRSDGPVLSRRVAGGSPPPGREEDPAATTERPALSPAWPLPSAILARPTEHRRSPAPETLNGQP